VSCASTQLCVLGTGSGYVLTSTDPTGDTSGDWTPASIGDGTFAAVSCPSTSLCVVEDTYGVRSWEGRFYTSTDPAGGASTWQPPILDNNQLLEGLTCPSAAFCIASGEEYVDGDIVYVAYATADPAGGVWRDPATPLATTDSCPSSSLCYAFGNNNGRSGNEVSVSSDPSGGASAWRSGPAPQANAASCPSASECVVTTGDEIELGVQPIVTATRLRPSHATVHYGHERQELLRVRVLPRHAGTPTGAVTITAAGKVVCTVHLRDGSGSCRLTARALRPGKYELAARYEGNGLFLGSSSPRARLHITG